MAALDGLPPNPSTALLSAGEAKVRLREIVEGFLFPAAEGRGWKAHRPAARQKAHRGWGKTTQAVEFAIRYQAEQEGKDGTRLSVENFNEAGVLAQTSIFIPRHHLAEELRAVIEAAPRKRRRRSPVPILRGRGN